ncbi:MAG TPA: DUF29 domain-containing protein [Burkholderiales bacterium]|nr:DUF29 domain-containing protein [Burkholderiales bacterium]
MQQVKNLYEKDFYAWTKKQAKLIKEKSFDKLDIVNLSEEVEDMGNRHADEIESRLCILLMHLLKWKYQPNLQSKSWEFTIKEQRRSIAKRLKKMPALKSKLPELFLEAYEDAIFEAEKETGLDESTFPKKCEWTIEQVLDDNFLPK